MKTHLDEDVREGSCQEMNGGGALKDVVRETSQIVREGSLIWDEICNDHWSVGWIWQKEGVGKAVMRGWGQEMNGRIRKREVEDS